MASLFSFPTLAIFLMFAISKGTIITCRDGCVSTSVTCNGICLVNAKLCWTESESVYVTCKGSCLFSLDGGCTTACCNKYKTESETCDKTAIDCGSSCLDDSRYCFNTTCAIEC